MSLVLKLEFIEEKQKKNCNATVLLEQREASECIKKGKSWYILELYPSASGNK